MITFLLRGHCQVCPGCPRTSSFMFQQDGALAHREHNTDWTCVRTPIASYRHATSTYDGCAIYAAYSQETRQRLVSALILSEIDYGNVVFAGLPGVTLAPLRIQPWMRRCSESRSAWSCIRPITAGWRDLHWLPIDQRIIYKLCTVMYAVKNGIAPTADETCHFH